ncbi:hypothetical protein C1H46_014759, partial [Malus baccata]
HNSVTEFEKRRHSADGFSRSGNEELKKVIRDNLVSQKLVENTESVEQGFTFTLEDNGFVLRYSLHQLKPELPPVTPPLQQQLLHKRIGGASCTIGSRRGNFLHQKEAEERQAKTKEKASRKLKASHPADLKPHKKEANDKKVDKIQKVTSVCRNSPEKDIVKSINVLKPQDQGKLTSAKARKHESESNITKNSISWQPSTATITISKRLSQNVARNSTERKRNHLRKNPAKKPKVTKSVASPPCL